MAKSRKASKGSVSLVPRKKNEFWSKNPKTNTVTIFILVGLVGVIFYISHLYADIRFGFALLVMEIIFISPLLAVILIRRRGRPYDSHFEKLPPPIKNARIEIHGDPARLVPFIDVEDETEFGEPHISEVGDVGGRGVFRILRLASIAVAANSLMRLSGIWIMGVSTQVNTRDEVFILKIALISFIASTLLMRIRTRYFRVVPQRLDVLHGGLFAKNPRLVTRYHLGNARMRIKLIEQVVLIRVQGHEQKLRISGLQDLNAFVRSLIHGTLTEREPPPMPDDALLG